MSSTGKSVSVGRRYKVVPVPAESGAAQDVRQPSAFCRSGSSRTKRLNCRSRPSHRVTVLPHRRVIKTIGRRDAAVHFQSRKE